MDQGPNDKNDVTAVSGKENESDLEEQQEQQNQLTKNEKDDKINDDDDDDDGTEEAESDETEDSSSFDSDQEGDYDGDDDDEMPLLKYARIVGSLPRSSTLTSAPTQPGKPLSKACKCSVMGRVTVSTTPTGESGMPSVSALGGLSMALSESSHGGTKANSATAGKGTGEQASSDDDILFTSRTQTFYIQAMAFEDGSIHLIDPRTGIHICPPNLMKVYANSQKPPSIVSLSFDASGTYLAALTCEGDVAIFEFRFGLTKYTAGEVYHDGSASKNNNNNAVSTAESRHERKVFDSFLSRLAGDEWSVNSEDTSSRRQLNAQGVLKTTRATPGGDGLDEKNCLPPIPTIKLTHPISTARFSYKSSNNKSTKATCICLDPSYKQKREKCIIVGFSSGRLVYTKRSGHGGVVSDSSGFGGVMGSLLQPKCHDVDLFQGVGASGVTGGGVKYHGIESIAWRGSLVSWADVSGIKLFDVDKLIRIAHIDRPTGARASLYPGISSLRPTLVFERSDSLLIAWGDCLMNMTIYSKEAQRSKSEPISLQSGKSAKRAVKCESAWQLDCIACGVAPMDPEHVVVLGLIPDLQSGDESTGRKIVELQVICRSNGTVIQSDVLPLIKAEVGPKVSYSTSDFVLNSSFATPRMEDSLEAEEEEYSNEEGADFDIQSILDVGMATSLVGSSFTKKFVDPHMKWDIASFKDVISSNSSTESSDDDESSLESGKSEYSDDYTFLFRPRKVKASSKSLLWQAPSMIITSIYDAVLVQTRDADDSIEHARLYGNYGLALRRGLDHRQIIRRHNLNDLINEYFTAVLLQDQNTPPLTINRLKIAARATEVLIGGNSEMWSRWVDEFAKIPGGLFLLRPHIPTRDPKLPHTLYEGVLSNMLSELEKMFAGQNEGLHHDLLNKLQDNAVDLLLEALRAWGSISSLRDRLKLHRITISDDADEDEALIQVRLYNEADTAFTNRMNQTAEHYLKYSISTVHHQADDLIHSANLPSGITFDSLFDMDTVSSSFQTKFEEINRESQNDRIISVLLEVLAETNFMKRLYKECLYNYLALATYKYDQLPSIEDEAMKSLPTSPERIPVKKSNGRYRHILTMIESYDLHRSLLKKRASTSSKTLPPLVCLICLVGLEETGNFIIQHCTLPRSKPSTPSTTSENRSDLPITQVAAQLNPYPKLLHWFLQRIFYEKPDIYVQFPNTAVPPSAVTDLHRIHFNLHVDYADRSFDEGKKLTTIPSFEELRFESPMMKFLKAALPHGGIRSDDVRKALQRCRTESDRQDSKLLFPHLFAHELAYVIERSGSGSEEDAKEVLTLLLEGAVSLPLAVEYVERNTPLSPMLWEALVTYCLDAEVDEPTENVEREKNGQLFGCLLEVAARSGSDLAHLVSKIPTGMSIHGIRSKLVTAISDYRFKVKINESAAKILSNDKVGLLREQCHRSRRGIRIDLFKDVEKSSVRSR